MSIRITTDVFCDGIKEDGLCPRSQWANGETDMKIKINAARENAKLQGFKRVRVWGEYRDLCPYCLQKFLKETP